MSGIPNPFRRAPSSFTVVVASLVVAKLVIHLATAARYGFFCDELYTIALSRHLDWGYVDLPPLVPALVALNRAIFGESLFATHIPPALAGAATIALVCLITRELGGRAFAVGLAGLAFLVAPVWLTLDSFFAYDSIDQLLLACLTFVLARLLRTGDARLWLVAGVIAGVAAMAKLTVLVLAPALLLALLLTRRRRDLLTPWPWLGGLAFGVIFSPFVVWQATNDWPTWAFLSQYGAEHAYHATLAEYLVSVILVVNPAAFPLLVLGAYRIFRPIAGTSFRLLGTMSLLGIALIVALHGRAFMMAQLFVPLIAAGAILVEELAARVPRPRVVQVSYGTALVAAGVLVAPAALPVLPPESLDTYAQHFGFLYQPVKDFTYEKNEYPQELANRLGWEELVAEVALVYEDLPPEDRARAGIWADWYGPAGAIDHYGPELGLPPAVSGHMTYHLWGPGENDWEVMIFVTADMEPFRPLFEEVEERAVIDNPFALPFNRLRLYVARGPRQDIDALWPQIGPYY